MSEQSKTLTRRKFLQGAAYASALSIGGASSLALAGSAYPQQGMTSSAVALLNQSNRALVLDAVQPVSLEQEQGWVLVKLNKIPEQNAVSGVTLAAGEQRSFVIDSDLVPALQQSGSHIVITNEHSVLDDMVPMATYDVVVV